MRKRYKYILLIVVIVIGLIILVACNNETEKSNKSDATSENIKVVTTLFPQYDFTKNILKDKADISLLLPPGVEAHSYDPTPKDIITINNSDIFIYTSNEMEPWVEKIINNIDREKVNIINLGENIKLEENHDISGINEGILHDGHDHEIDPHFWTNPKMAKEAVLNLSLKLKEILGNNQDFIEENTVNYITKLEKLDQKIRKDLENINNRTIIYAGHFAFGYFVKEYDLLYLTPYEGFSPNAEPSPKNISKLIDIMDENSIKSIYYEELIEPKVAKIISEQTGAKMYLLHAAHNISKEELEENIGYIEIMYQNLENLKEGLGYAK